MKKIYQDTWKSVRCIVSLSQNRHDPYTPSIIKLLYTNIPTDVNRNFNIEYRYLLKLQRSINLRSTDTTQCCGLVEILILQICFIQINWYRFPQIEIIMRDDCNWWNFRNNYYLIKHSDVIYFELVDTNMFKWM